jgi:hypothetical protein
MVSGKLYASAALILVPTEQEAQSSHIDPFDLCDQTQSACR